MKTKLREINYAPLVVRLEGGTRLLLLKGGADMSLDCLVESLDSIIFNTIIPTIFLQK
jgi:hypothetical protein